MPAAILLLIVMTQTVAESRAAAAEPPRPNIIVIMSDDMGFSDIGCYGGEIRTPNLDALAANGLRFTQFYNTARCCPTRACLMTGLYPHQAGVGHMMNDRGTDGYRGDLNRNCMTIAEVLKTAGYGTYMSGKWHVTKHTPPDGPKHNWPRQRGFDRFYGTIHGAGSFYDPNSLTRDNTQISPYADPEYKPKQYYYTDAISDHAVRFIREHNGEQSKSRPFFMYVAYTAAHWPMHALPKDIAKYRGRYDNGYAPVRAARLKKARELGLIQPDWKMSPQAERWDKVSNKSWEARCMEVYAAMVDNMDQGIGRIVAELKKNGQFDNTLILFLQDNGGCAEGLGRRARGKTPNPKRSETPRLAAMKPTDLQRAMIPKTTREGAPLLMGKNVMPGPADTYIAYGRGWANVSNTPFREYKHWVHEGGISTPLIAHWPAGIAAKGQLRNTPSHLIDIMATCIDLSGARYPKTYKGKSIQTPEGKSLTDVFAGKPLDERPIFWEHEGNRAVRIGDWKLANRRLEQLKSDMALKPDVKQRIETYYTQASKTLSKASDFDNELRDLESLKRSAAQFKREAEKELARPIVEPPKVDASRDLQELEDRLKAVKADKQAAESELDFWQKKAEQRANKADIPQRLIEAKRDLVKAKADLQGDPPSGEPAEAVPALRFLQQAQVQALESEIKLLEQKLPIYKETDELIKLKIQAAQHWIQRTTKLIGVWERRVEEHRGFEARRQVAESQTMVDNFKKAGLDQTIIEMAQENLRLAQRRIGNEGTVAKLNTLLYELADAEALLKKLEAERKELEDKLVIEGIEGEIGPLLVVKRRELPNVSRYQRRIAQRNSELSKARLSYIDTQQKASRLSKFDAEVQAAVNKAANTSDKAARARIEVAVRNVLLQRKAIYEVLLKDYNTLLENLGQLTARERKVIDSAQKFRDLIDRHILWVRTTNPYGIGQLRDLPYAIQQVFSAEQWLQTANSLENALFSRPILSGFMLLLLAFALYRLPTIKRQLYDAGRESSRGFLQPFSFTLRAFVLTAFLAALWPVAFWYAGWSLQTYTESPPFSEYTGTALEAVAVSLFTLDFLRRMFRPRGLAESHFRWKNARLRLMRRHLRWFTAAALPGIFLYVLVREIGDDRATTSMGRLMLVVLLLLVACFLAVVLRDPKVKLPFSEVLGVQHTAATKRASMWQIVAFLTIVLFPVVLAGVAIAGYMYTAALLTWKLVCTAWLAVAMLTLHAMCVRWLYYARGKLALEQAAAAKAAAEVVAAATAVTTEQKTDESSPQSATSTTATTETSGPTTAPATNPLSAEAPPPGPTTDLATIKTQTRRLLQIVIGCMIVVGLWSIWKDVVPALKFLEYPLWTYQVETTREVKPGDKSGAPEPMTVVKNFTLGDMLLAVAIVVVVFVAASNLPGLLEVGLLQKLPLDSGSRYAATALSRYGIYAIGTVMAFNMMGIGWNKVQWLVAALSVGLGFGLQEIVANFVSGIILLFERPLRVGDVVTIGDVSGVVTRIQIRATTVRNWDRKEYIVPNKELITGKLMNWTLSDSINRIVVNVGVAYGSDPNETQRILMGVVSDHPDILKDPEPMVTMEAFGDSSLNFVIRCCLADLGPRLKATHEIHAEIHHRLAEAGIEIPFPQRDLHLRIEIGAFTKSFQDRPIPEVCRIFKKIGLDGLDLTVRPGGHIEPKNVTAELPRAAEAAKNAGTRLLFLTTGITDADDDAERVLAAAAKAGVRRVKLGYYRYRKFGTLSKQIDAVRKRLAGVIELAGKHGVRPCVHIHSGSFLPSHGTQLYQLIHDYKPTDVGAYVDPLHMTLEGGRDGWRQGLDLLAPWIALCSIKNFDWVKSKRDRHGQLRWKTRTVPVADGICPLPDFFATLRQTGYRGPYSLHSEYKSSHSFRRLDTDGCIEQTARDLKFGDGIMTLEPDSGNEAADSSTPTRSPGGRWIWFGLVALTLAVYLQTWQFDFVDYDDGMYVFQNPHVLGGLSGENVAWAFTTTATGNWAPLTWLSLMFDAEWFGKTAGGFHFTNVVLHVANTLLLFAVLRRMTGAVGNSAVVAALFAVHPLHVESVAWVSERKDVLSTLFGLAALYGYVRFVENRSTRWLAASIAGFVFSLMAKQMLVTLPFLLLVLDYWPLRRMSGEQSWRRFGMLVKEKSAYFAITLIFCVVAYWAQAVGGNVHSFDQFPFVTRLENAVVSYALYMRKTVWPNDLAVFYPHPGDAIAPVDVGIGAAVLLVTTILAYAQRQRRPYLLAGWLWFLGTLVPVIGLVQIGGQQLADRYSYIPIVGLLIAVTWGIASLSQAQRAPAWQKLLATGAILGYAAAGWVQAGYWQNGVTLFQQTLAATGDDNFVAHYNLGNMLRDERRRREAAEHYRRAMQLRPDDPRPAHNLGVVLEQLGRADDAVAAYRLALKADSKSAGNRTRPR
eukprot:g33032.t1